MNEHKVKQYLKTVLKLEGLEFMFNDGTKIVFSSPGDDIRVDIDTRTIYDVEGEIIGEIDRTYDME